MAIEDIMQENAFLRENPALYALLVKRAGTCRGIALEIKKHLEDCFKDDLFLSVEQFENVPEAANPFDMFNDDDPSSNTEKYLLTFKVDKKAKRVLKPVVLIVQYSLVLQPDKSIGAEQATLSTHEGVVRRKSMEKYWEKVHAYVLAHTKEFTLLNSTLRSYELRL
ncbi:MAG: hypothetical protein V1743_03850 [Nanoarchaeota archaeon]